MDKPKANVLLKEGDALLIADMQNDFMPGGALAVSGADQIVPVLNAYIGEFQRRRLPILVLRDWHPPNHSSFQAQGGVWPVHCVANSVGAAFVATLELPVATKVISKGTDIAGNGYSGFELPELHETLQNLSCRRLFVGGVATDYCVLQTASDACRLGYTVLMLSDGVRAVDLQPGDGARAINALQKLGVGAVTLADIRAQ